MLENMLWVERYRPKRIADTILPADLKKTFQQFVDQRMIPNLLLAGGPGIGKTTVAKAMLEELGCDYIVINGSMNGNIDTLRNEIKDFASSVSFSGGRKYVIIDESDYLGPLTQPALRNFVEEYSANCGMILTCNILNRIIPPLQSRFSVIKFNIDKNDKPVLAGQFMKRLETILQTEGVEYDKGTIAELIMKHFPDWRRVINECQRYAATGRIDVGILSSFSDESFANLVKHLKEKSFTEVRRWIVENSDVDPQVVMRKLYDSAYDLVTPSFVPQLVLILADYQHKAAFVVDQELNLAACMVELMATASWR